jgi:hypothetical protein
LFLSSLGTVPGLSDGPPARELSEEALDPLHNNA